MASVLMPACTQHRRQWFVAKKIFSCCLRSAGTHVSLLALHARRINAP